MLEALRDFVERVEGLGVEYMVTGSFAMSAYGEIRFTRDIDVVIELAGVDAEKFAVAFEDEYYIEVASVRHAVSRESMFNLIDNKHGVKIDCIVLKDSPIEKRKFQNRRLTRIADTPFWIITKEDLILSKLQWARDSRSEMQIKDIANLTANEYDSRYIMQWVEKLDLVDIWSAVEEWKIQHLK